MLTIKMRCLIAYCHTILVEAEEMTEEGKGISIIEDEDTRVFIKQAGRKIIEFCEMHNSTRDSLADLSAKRYDLFLLARIYYKLQIDLYLKYISKIEGRHIPILYAGLMFQLLQKNNIVSLDIDYDRLISEIELSQSLETSVKISKISGKEIIERTEVNKYHNGVREILEQTIKLKVIKKTKNKKKRK